MGTVFEELIRKFNEALNENPGEHFTPRDVVHLMVDLMLAGDEKRMRRVREGFHDDAAVLGIKAEVCTADVGLVDPHWWVEHGGEALDVIFLESHGLCVSVEAMAEFRERRNVLSP